MTTTLNLALPTVGGDANTWGTKLNTALTIVNSLGGVQVVNVNSAYLAVFTPYPETIIRGTTSGLNVPITLPDSASVQGKIWVVKKLDAGAGTLQIFSQGTDTIDNQTEWDLTNQYQYVRLYANGTTGYDVIGSS
jgi:hypothetical protein